MAGHWTAAAVAVCCIHAAASAAGRLDDTSGLLQVDLSITEQEDVSYFLDNKGLVCSDGPSRSVEATIASKKASPLGALYNASFARAGKTCKDLGYTLAGGIDKCFPEVQQAFRSESKVQEFLLVKSEALKDYQTTYSLDEKIASVMVVCTCHPQSPLREQMAKHCEGLSKLYVGSWVHRNPITGKQLNCDEGPFEYATRALATIKSSPLMPMHLSDTIAPIPCAKQGFPLLYGAIDHCYPMVHMWTRTEQPMHNCPPGGLGPNNPDCDDWGVVEAGQVERNLFKEGGFQAFSRKNQLSTVLDNNPACNCRAGSLVIKMTEKREGRDVCSPVSARSPVRDFWTG